MSWRVLVGDVREQLAVLPDSSVQCVVTSPPYWGLRDYGHARQIGLEATPADFVAVMVAVFGDVRRVLKNDGVLWLNLGNSYAAGGQNSGSTPEALTDKQRSNAGCRFERRVAPDGLKQKDLAGIPWRVAFALQADGWYLRSDIIWSKPNPMPESVTDRPTKSHEYIFLLSKSERYYYDAGAIAELVATSRVGRERADLNREQKRHKTPGQTPQGYYVRGQSRCGDVETRNCRTVWTIPTQPYPDAHFATFPEALPERCIKAGSRGPGKRCDCDEVIKTPLGSGPTRREQRSYAEQMKASPHRDAMATAAAQAFAHYIRTDKSGARPLPAHLLSEWMGRGWLVAPAPCNCAIEPGDTVLDPFCGSGTTGQVAIQLGRSFTGIELNPAYAELARKRISGAAPLFANEATA